jgi:diaminopimelate epimerase
VDRKTRIEFTKMQGIGNDYVYINTLNQTVSDPAALARQVSDRHFGIGSDGLVLIRPSAVADFMMDMYNSDGSQAKMCGNAIRCVARYVYERGLTSKKNLAVDTLSGIKTLELLITDGCVRQVTVNMGQPVFESALIPIRWKESRMVEEPVAVAGHLYKITCVSMGNPHAVTFVNDVEGLDLLHLGPLFEHLALFPDRVNTEFVQVIDRQNLRMRVWERGAGETMACGTGACAALAAAVITGRCDRSATVHLNGGDLAIEWDNSDNTIMMTGPATFVFDGWIEIDE